MSGEIGGVESTTGRQGRKEGRKEEVEAHSIMRTNPLSKLNPIASVGSDPYVFPWS